MTQERLKYLFEQLSSNKISGLEMKELDGWYEKMQQGTDHPIVFSSEVEKEVFIQEMTEDLVLKMDSVNNLHKWRKVNYVRYYSIAAIFVLIIFSTFFYIYNNQKTTQQKKNTLVINNNSAYEQDTIMNNTSSVMRQRLTDGSEIELYPKSTVSYSKKFVLKTREVQLLSGAAKFKVKKNVQSPFIVISKDYSTTALGTTFLVDISSQKSLKVKLLEGKVVVQLTNEKTDFLFKPVYLIAGNEVEVTHNNHKAIVKKTTGINKATNKQPESIQYKNKYVRQDIVFEQCPLQAVLDSLTKYYNKDISYNIPEISLLEFSGIIRKEHELATVLNKICMLNELELTETKKGYRITKK